MDILRELEAMRKRMVQEINTEFDLLIERARSEGMTAGEPAPAAPYQDYESAYPLTAGSKIFKGKKPTRVIFPDGKQVRVISWKQVVAAVMERCLQSTVYRDRLKALSDVITGRKRRLLAKTEEGMRSPLKLCDDLFMETHYDTETLLNVLTIRILGAVQYDYSAIQVAIRNR